MKPYKFDIEFDNDTFSDLKVPNDKELEFLRNYIKTGDPKHSANTAGYTPNYGYKLLKKFSNHIQRIRVQQFSPHVAEVTEIQAILTNIARDESKKDLHRINACNSLLKVQGAGDPTIEPVKIVDEF